MDSLENRIKVAREHANLTQKQLSELLGLSLRSMTNHEKNACNVSVSLAQNIAQKCNVDEIWLLTGRGSIEGHRDAIEKKSEPPKFASSHSPIVSEHHDIIKKFKNPKLGKEVNEDLVELEELSDELYIDTLRHIKSTLNAARVLGGSKKTQKIRQGARKNQPATQKKSANGN